MQTRMIMSRCLPYTIALSAALLLTLTASASPLADNTRRPSPSPAGTGPVPHRQQTTSISASRAKLSSGKLESTLHRLEQMCNDRGFEEATAFATSHGLRIKGNSVLVTVRPHESQTVDAVDLPGIEELGGVVRARSTHFLDIAIPFDRLTALSDCPGVAFVGRLMELIELYDSSPERERSLLAPDGARATLVRGGRVVSEGVTLTGADIMHSNGYYGAGIEVAIIDMGFEQMQAAFDAGELGPFVYYYDFTGLGMETGGCHGTAVAENVHDMAPDAVLNLLKVLTMADIENAKDYCVTYGIKVVNMSLGACGGPNDGTYGACAIVEDAYTNGILWVNSAGNNALCHNEGVFTDDDGDGFHEFWLEDETINIFMLPGQSITLYLTWDAWPLTYADYDLYLYDSTMALVGWAITSQNPGLPQEVMTFTSVAGGVYHIVIDQYSALMDYSYDLMATSTPARSTWFHPNYGGEYYVESGSITSPADAPHAFAVGAIHRDDWTTGPAASFSSRGPTNDGRIKPDIAGPDSCASFAYTPPGYWIGTSSSAPHVAGAAALVWASLPELVTVDDIWDWLADNAVDMGFPGQDNVYGFGRLNIPPDTPVEGAFYAILTEAGTAMLRWTVASLAGVDGFNVYRATSPDGPFIRINEAFIAPVSPGDYEDTTLWPGTTFWYQLRVLYSGGSEDVVSSSIPSITTPGRLVARLYNAAPNPLTDHTSIQFDIPDHAGPVKVGVHDVRGRLIKTLFDGHCARGRQSVQWDARDNAGTHVASGVYFLRLQVEDHVRTSKLLVAR